MIKRLLIANRGEIALRIIKTAKKLGIETVIPYAYQDKYALPTKLADISYALNGEKSADTYLCIEKIITIAKLANVDAIHPGYGFLSENADFAYQCEQAGFIFVGPTSEAIALMASKATAKKIMAIKGVPIVPGYEGKEQGLANFIKAAREIGYPILLKAALGGGGKGMKIVSCENDLDAALMQVKREAISSFNNEEIILEKYLPETRHVEVQIFADKHGNCIHLLERDCSLQRRHQKIIEEAPSSYLDDNLREEIGKTAVKAAKAINYIGAGTIEFLLTPDNKFYFMEMNTRLQVEHPVTEMITGLDLVEWQILVANNKVLPKQQLDIKAKGVAIEARIYAEDPKNNFLPQSGIINEVKGLEQNEFIRLDSAIEKGSNISIHFDPMIGKLIAHANSHAAARKKLKLAIAKIHINPLLTNLAYLHTLLSYVDENKEPINTNFINAKQNEILAKENKVDLLAKQIIAISYFAISKKQLEKKSDPWFKQNSWQLNLPSKRYLNLKVGETNILADIINLKSDDYLLEIEQGKISFTFTWEAENSLLINFTDKQIKIFVYKYKHMLQVANMDFYHSALCLDELEEQYFLEEQNSGSLTSPMPGTVIGVNVKEGEKIEKGQNLLILEAMKMEYAITANSDGIITEVNCKTGDIVAEGAKLITIDEF